MIEKHLALSCFTLQQPFTACYSHFGEEVVDLIDRNHDIYEFKLADTELYEKINCGEQVKKIQKVASLCMLLYESGKFMVRKGIQELYTCQDIAQMEIMQVNSQAIVVLRSNTFYNKNQLQLQIGIIKEEGEKQVCISFERVLLEEQAPEHYHFQKYVSQYGGSHYKIERIINRCCLIVDNSAERFIFNLNYQKFIENGEKTLKYRKLDFQLHENYSIDSNFKDYLLIFDIDSEHQRIVLLKDLQPQGAETDYIIYNNFAIVVTANNLSIFQTLKGNKMAQINIDLMLQEFEQGSTIILKEQLKKQVRYGLLFDTLKPKLTHFYLIDKEKLNLFHFNINKLLQRGFIKTLKQNLQGLESDDDKYHENIMKTLNFRVKKLETLQKYLLQDLKSGQFANTVRFLINEQTIYVLNDGLSLFYHAIIGNISKLMNSKQNIVELELSMVKICHRLITQSNYENQIANGLHILNGIYTNFRKYQQIQSLEKNKQAYNKLLQSHRVTKLLKNQKKKRLFELSYELALKIKGYKYLQTLDLPKGM